MSLEDLANLGEFVGAIGVVVSFVFLAVQVRNNTKALRDAAAKDMLADPDGHLWELVNQRRHQLTGISSKPTRTNYVERFLHRSAPVGTNIGLE